MGPEAMSINGHTYMNGIFFPRSDIIMLTCLGDGPRDDPDFLSHVRPYAEYSSSSHATSKYKHIPALESYRDGGPEVVLLGDTFIEQMATVGGMQNFSPWPPVSMMAATPHDRLPRVFNAGATEETIGNVIYRVVGDPERGLKGLGEVLRDREVRLFVVHVGTNHLRGSSQGPDRGLSTEDKDLLGTLLKALMECSRVRPMVLLTGLFYRWDVERNIVDEANERLSLLAGWMYIRYGKEWVVYLPANDSVNAEEHMPDGVHLSRDGYVAWTRSLFPAVRGCLVEQRLLDY